MPRNVLTLTFQFHKGAIRTGNHVDDLNGFNNFNSIKVRLEQDGYTISRLYVKFQFHKGAIRTTDAMVATRRYRIFQFHKGAIRT